MRLFARVIVAALMVLVGAVVGYSVPQLINYQGILTDAGGTPITVATNVQFTFFGEPIAGDALWSETQSVIPDTDGRFNVLLGSVNPIPDSVFDQDVYLNIIVDVDPPIMPRTQLISVAFSYRTNSVDGALGGSISGDVEISGKATIGSSHTNSSNGGFVTGTENFVSGSQSSVGGGNFNGASGSQAVTAGGFLNNASGDWTTVSGGYSNFANNTGATVGGGRNNKARGEYAVVAGGGGAAAADSNSAVGDGSAVGGGVENAANGDYSTVSGGLENTAGGLIATIGGGNRNITQGTQTTIAGGFDNQAISTSATVGGGDNNVASGVTSTISGGNHNTASGQNATIAGGFSNTAVGDYSFAVGLDCAADHDYSVTLGRRAKSQAFGQFVFADYLNADFAPNGQGEFCVRASGGVGLGSDNPGNRALVVDNAFTGEATEMVSFEASVPVTTSGRDLFEIEALGSDVGIQYIECQRGADIEFRVHGDGDVTADGAFTGGGADFAELVRVSTGATSVMAGDVMMIDPSNPHAVKLSSQPRSRLVAGIFSTSPGYIASERDWDQVALERAGKSALDDHGGELPYKPVVELAAELDEVPLAVVGIVPCKVSAENGPIQTGDLLVTSSTPGHAMRDDNPGVGTVLGKALQPLDSATGVIKVLVTLQ